MSNEQVSFRHYRNTIDLGLHDLAIHNKGGITMAFIAPKHINDLTDQDQVKVGFGFCSIDDNFVHAVGRYLATERLHANDDLFLNGEEFRTLLRVHSAEDLAPTARCLIDPSLATDLIIRNARRATNR